MNENEPREECQECEDEHPAGRARGGGQKVNLSELFAHFLLLFRLSVCACVRACVRISDILMG